MLVPVVFVTCLVAAAPDAQVERYVFAAVQLFEKLEFEQAIAHLQKAKLHSRGVDDDVKIGLLEGVMRAELNAPAEAELAFRTALLLKPDAELPLKVSPTVLDQFKKVQAEARAAAQTQLKPLTTVPDERPALIPEVKAAPPRRDARPWAALPAVVAVGLGAAGGALYFLATRSLQQLTDPSQPAPGSLEGGNALVNQGQLYQGLGFASFAVAGAALIAALGVLLLGGPGTPAQ